MLRYKKIFVGKICNNRCRYCNYRGEDIREPDLNNLIDAIKDQKPDNSSYDGIMFYGGEPVLRKDIFFMIKEARLLGWRRIKILTNGRAFSYPELVDVFINEGCSIFEIKIFGSKPDIHDAITQVPNSFFETIRGFENLANNQKKKFVCARISVNRNNFVDLENIVALVINMMVNRIILSVDDYTISLKALLPHVRNAINISIFNRVWVLTEGLRFCNMNGLEKHISEIYSGWNADERFVYSPECERCVLKLYCPGISEKYASIYGYNEFEPAVDRKIAEDLRILNA